jgi:hypothetical protein
MVTDLLRRSPNWGPSILEGTLENLAEKAFVREIQRNGFLDGSFRGPSRWCSLQKIRMKPEFVKDTFRQDHYDSMGWVGRAPLGTGARGIFRLDPLAKGKSRTGDLWLRTDSPIQVFRREASGQPR